VTRKNAFTVSAKRTGNKVRLTLSGYIYPGSERTSAASIAEQLDAMKDGDELTVLIRNCNGGSVPEGMTIYHDLVDLEPTVLVDGVAASMGAIIALAGKTIKMSRHSKMMLHRVSMGAEGDPDQVAEAAKQALQYENELVSIVAHRTGKSETKTRALYFNGHDVWLDADACLKAGLVDEVVKGSLRKEIPNRELKKQDPAGVVAVFEAAMRPEPQRVDDQDVAHAISNGFKQIMKLFTNTDKKKPAPKAPKPFRLQQLANVAALDASEIKAGDRRLRQLKVNAFLVPMSEKVKSAADLQALLDKRYARIKALKAANEQLEKTIARLQKRITGEAPESKQKKDPQIGTKSVDPMAAVHDPKLEWNAMADEQFGAPGQHNAMKKKTKKKMKRAA